MKNGRKKKKISNATAPRKNSTTTTQLFTNGRTPATSLGESASRRSGTTIKTTQVSIWTCMTSTMGSKPIPKILKL